MGTNKRGIARDPLDPRKEAVEGQELWYLAAI